MKKTYLTLSAAALLFGSVLQAETPEEKGLRIAQETDARDTGWGDWSAEAIMTLTNRHGESSQRQMRIASLEKLNAGDKRRIVFDHPRDVKGTAFLVHTARVGNDDQWLFLPALKRVKRIASRNQSGPFVGSEFAYEDLSSQEVEKYSYRYVGEDVVGGLACYMIERDPVDSESGYTRQIVWIDQAEYRVLKTDFYDRKNELLKTLTSTGWKEYAGNFWRASRFEMVNHQTGKSTVLDWEDYVFSKGLSDGDFNKTSLKRAR